MVCDLPAKVPLNRVLFQIAPDQVNFRPRVTVENASRRQESAGEISRVRVNRAGTLVTSEDLAVDIAGSFPQIIISVDNEDNPPLTILSAQPLTIERRVILNRRGRRL